MHWEIKKQISTKMSAGEIDRWYETAKANGAYGGKIGTGAGGGGFFMFYCANGKSHLRDALTKEGLERDKVQDRYRGLEGPPQLKIAFSSIRPGRAPGVFA